MAAATTMRPAPTTPARAPLRAALALAAGLLALGVAQADVLWLQRDAAGGARVLAGDPARPATALPVLAAPRAYLADGKDLALAPQAAHIGIAATPPAQDLRFAARSDSGKGVLTYHHARWGRAETQAVNDLELVPTEPGGNTFKLVWKGAAVAASQVNVETSAGWRRTLAPGPDGTVRLETPFPGVYLLEVTARVNGAATVDGRKYEDVRHTATLSFEVVR